MNHLEPLSWRLLATDDVPTAHESRVLVQQNLAATLSLSARSTFQAIASFLEGCRQSVPQARLLASMAAASELGRTTLDLAMACGSIRPALRWEFRRCLGGLDRLTTSLSAGECPPHQELAHELDTLIALLVELCDAGSFPARRKPMLATKGRPTARMDARSPRPGRLRPAAPALPTPGRS